MTRIPESELVLNPDGSIYHLNLHPDQIAKTIITVGDPDRVAQVSKYFDRIEVKVQKREFITHTGELNGKRLTVVATGIGTDNIDIVLNELDALTNIDLKTRTIKNELTSLEFIRIGTSGCLQSDIPLDSFLVSTHGIGLDGLLHFYNYQISPAEEKLQKQFFEEISGKIDFPLRPYFAAGNSSLLESIGGEMLRGITVTCPGFYAPQGRALRIPAAFKDVLERLGGFSFENERITNFEMETAAMYGFANMMGHRAVSCNALIANRQLQTFSKDPHKTIGSLIEIVLEKLTG